MGVDMVWCGITKSPIYKLKDVLATNGEGTQDISNREKHRVLGGLSNNNIVEKDTCQTRISSKLDWDQNYISLKSFYTEWGQEKFKKENCDLIKNRVGKKILIINLQERCSTIKERLSTMEYSVDVI